jgi:hypothetical protein
MGALNQRLDQSCTVCVALTPTTSATMLPSPALASMVRPSLAPNSASICSPATSCQREREVCAGVCVGGLAHGELVSDMSEPTGLASAGGKPS